MIFKNLQIYRVPTDWGITADELNQQLAEKPLRPCGSQDMESRGWLPPLPNGTLVHAVGGQWLVALGVEHRLLPAAVVREEADERAAELAEQQGYKPGRKQMKELREQVEQELMPRAFTRKRRTFAWIDPKGGWLVVDAASPARAEDVLEQLRHTLERFPLRLLRTERSARSAMAGWLYENDAPAGFSIDDEFTVEYDNERVAVKHIDIIAAHAREHLDYGRYPTRIAMTFDDRVSFVLTDKLEVKRLDFLDLVREQLSSDHEDEQAKFDAEFALMTGELQRLLPALVEALGGELSPAEDLL